MKLKSILLGVLMATGAGAGTASANSVLVDFDHTSNAGGGKTSYTYDVYLGATPGQSNSLMNGDCFTLFNIPGLFGTPSFSGPYAGSFSSPTIQNSNIVCTYKGKSTLSTSKFGGDIFLGDIVLTSLFGCNPNSDPIYCFSNDHGADCSSRCNNGWICGPTDPHPTIPASNAGLGGAGLLALLGLSKLRKTRTASV